MNIVQLTSSDMDELRKKRAQIVSQMAEQTKGSFIVLTTAYAGQDKGHQDISYPVFSIFLEIWDRYNFETWSYTYDREGLVFYMNIDEDPQLMMDVLSHYEENHPLGFAINFDVYGKDIKHTSEYENLNNRIDEYYKTKLSSLLDRSVEDLDYSKWFKKRVEAEIISGNSSQLMSNLLVYGFISGYAKEYGFGMYGPSYKGSNDKMNFEKFIYMIKSLKEDIKRITNINTQSLTDIVRLQNDMHQNMLNSVLSQQSHLFSVRLISNILVATYHAKNYSDISKHIAHLGDKMFDESVFEYDELERYVIYKNGLKDVFHFYVPYLHKSQSITQTGIYIMSRHDDFVVKELNHEQNLLKLQFLAKNLVDKKDKWIELDRFCSSVYLYPSDSTSLLVATSMLELIHHHFTTIKKIFENTDGGN